MKKFFILFLLISLVPKTDVLAEKINIDRGLIEWDYGDIKTRKMSSEDGEEVYCIKPGVAFPIGTHMKKELLNDEKLLAILAYSKDNRGKFAITDDQYYISVYIALNAYLGNFDIKEVKKANSPIVNSILNNAFKPELVLENKQVLKFNVWKGVFEKTLILPIGEYDFYSDTLNFIKSGNKLTVFTKDNSQEHKLRIKRKFQSNHGLIFTSSKNVQDVIQLKRIDDVEEDVIEFTSDEYVLEVEKLDEDNRVLEGVELELYDGEKSIKRFTSKEGKVYFVLQEGSYKLFESKPLVTYKQDMQVYQVELNNNNKYEKIVIVNEKQKLIISKTDEKENPLEGVEFQITLKRAGKNNVEVFKTDENGKIVIENILLNDRYYVKEIATINGYAIDDFVKEIVIDNTLTDFKLEVVNKKNLLSTGKINKYMQVVGALLVILFLKVIILRKMYKTQG